MSRCNLCVSQHISQQDGERGALLFTATMTVVRNGRVCEVPFDAQTDSFDLRHKGSLMLPAASTGNRESTARKVRVCQYCPYHLVTFF